MLSIPEVYARQERRIREWDRVQDYADAKSDVVRAITARALAEGISRATP